MPNVTIIIDGEEVASHESIFGDEGLLEETADALNGRNRVAFGDSDE